jgi:hypothetical protein
VDRLIEVGQPIQRIEDYDEWVSRFETAMRGLAEKQRFRATVRAVGYSIRHLSALLIGKYIADLRQLQVLWCCL